MPTTVDAKYKYQELKGCLIQRIQNGTYVGGRKIASEPELCREFGLSRNTIRQAVKDLEQSGMLYRVQGKGTFVRNQSPQESRKIALVIYDVSYATHPLTAGLIRGIDAGLSENNFMLDILASRRSFQDENFSRLASHYAGFLIGAHQMDSLTLQELQNLGVPHLFVKNYQPGRENEALRINYYRAGFLAAEHLIEQGRRELALVYGKEDVAIYREYRAGVVDACLEYGVRLRSGHIYPVDFLNDDMSLEEVGHSLTEAENQPDGVIVIDDHVAVKLIDFLQCHNRTVPRDVAVVGCNNSEISRLHSPTLTTVEIPTFELGKLAALAIVKRVEGIEFESRCLDVRLLIRESSIG